MLTNAITPDKSGGLERYVRELSSAVAARGADVTILAKRATDDLPLDETADDGVRIIRYPVPHLSDPLFVPRRVLGPLRTALREARRPPDRVIHAHFPVPALPLPFSGRPYLYTFHAPVHREIAAERNGRYALPGVTEAAGIAAMKATERLVLGRADRVVVLSEFMRGELARFSRRAALRASLVAGGIDTRRFRPGPPIGDDWATSDAPLIFTARRLTRRTGVRELIRALPLIRRRVPEARLAVAGVGRMRQQLEDEVDALPDDDRRAVRLLGHVSDEDLVGWYRAARVVAMPTQELEGFGLTSAEAMACGTPVVATPVGANREVVGSLDQRLLTAGTSPEDIAETVTTVLTGLARDPVVREAAEHHGRSFGWDAVADRYLAEYAELRR
jgi:glycosyltransferase involved in cell wall biosynthesis